jgi:uncharacterized membrane protein YfcA
MLHGLSGAELLLAFIIVTSAAAVQGSLGFGFNLIVVPLLALLDFRFVPAPVICVSLALALLTARRDRRGMDIEGIRLALMGRIPGTVVGILTLRTATSGDMGLIVGMLVCLAVALSAYGLPIKISTLTLLIAGVISGFMSTTVAIGGPALILLFQHEPGGYVRGTLSAYFAVGALMSLIALAAVEQFGEIEFYLGLSLMPGVLAGFAISKYMSEWVDRRYLRPAILFVSGVAGIVITLRSLA